MTDRERIIQLLAANLEYEHALQHVAEVSEYHEPGACLKCQEMCRSALDGVNRADFTEMATEQIDAEG